MATSRTGTTQWMNARDYALKVAQEQGQTSCPHCQVELDYVNKRTANGAWVDHRVPYVRGGTDDAHNLVVCCRTCNTSKGDRAAPKARTTNARKPLRTSRVW